MYLFIVGGFGVTNVTLVRVFSAHICLAFVIVGLTVIHLFYLHSKGSKNPIRISLRYGDVVYFHPLFRLKDGFVMMMLFFIMSGALMIKPDIVLDVERYIEADPMVTPTRIKPEWYFLFFYAMLRSVESKIGGLALVLVFLVIL